MWVDSLKSMAHKQNLPFPALLHHPFAALWSDFFRNRLKISVTPLWTGGRWTSVCSLVTFQAAILHMARNSTAAIFTSASYPSCRWTWDWGGQTSMWTKSFPLASSQRELIQWAAQTPEQCFRQPKPTVYSTLDCELWKPQSAFRAAAQH